MITEKLPYSHRAGTAAVDPGTPFSDIVADQPERPRPPRKDLRPIIILAIVLGYTVTVGVGAVVVVNNFSYGIARACIESGGEWVIASDTGARECVHPERGQGR